MRNYECVGCGKKMDGGTFLCLTAWCAECYAHIGKEAIIAAADAVEGEVNAYRSALLAKKFRTASPEVKPSGWWNGTDCNECGSAFAAVDADGLGRCPDCGWTDDQQAEFIARMKPAPLPEVKPTGEGPRCPICKEPESHHLSVWYKGNPVRECPVDPRDASIPIAPVPSTKACADGHGE